MDSSLNSYLRGSHLLIFYYSDTAVDCIAKLTRADKKAPYKCANVGPTQLSQSSSLNQERSKIVNSDEAIRDIICDKFDNAFEGSRSSRVAGVRPSQSNLACASILMHKVISIIEVKFKNLLMMQFIQIRLVLSWKPH